MREAANVLDPYALTLGFARRFTGYKRPNLLLKNLARLSRLLNDPARPVHLVLAGKAHPANSEGKKMIRDWIAIAQRPEFRRRIVFLKCGRLCQP
jgi:glycogen phosphorylase